MAMRSLPTDQQKDSYEVCSMQCTLDEWNSSQYPTKAVCKPSGRCNALARLGRMVSGLGRQLGRSARSLAVDERQISGEIPLTSKQQKQQIRTASDQRSQEQEQREGKRKIRKRCWQRNDGIQSEPFALCSPSSRNATLATIGEQHQCPNANSGANLCSTGDRDNCPKERSVRCSTCGLHRSSIDAIRDQRSYCQVGGRDRTVGERVHEGHNKKIYIRLPRPLAKRRKRLPKHWKQSECTGPGGRSMWQKQQRRGKDSCTSTASSNLPFKK